MDIGDVLNRLGLEPTGKYEGSFYVLPLQDSNEYAKTYTLLDEKAINTEYPSFGKNTNDSTVKVTNYFELDAGDATYNLFLIADFDGDRYYLKIGEKK